MSNIKGFAFDKTKCKVYDVETKRVIGVFETITGCAKALGLTTSRVQETMKRKGKNRTNNLGKTITIRSAS